MIESIFFYILLVDSIGAVLVALYGKRWFNAKFRPFSKLFPLTPGWAFMYLGLVLWVGSLLYRSGMLW